MKNPKFLRYLKLIGMSSDTLIGEVDKAQDHCQRICPGEFKDIFVDDYIGQDGRRVYESVTFFAHPYSISAELFTGEQKYGLGNITNRRFYLTFDSKDYDFEKATEKSRLSVEWLDVSTGEQVGYLKGTKENCDALMKILKEYFFRYL